MSIIAPPVFIPVSRDFASASLGHCTLAPLQIMQFAKFHAPNGINNTS